MTLTYGSLEMQSIRDLLRRLPDAEFMKLTRSTVPLLAFWSTLANRDKLMRVLGFTSEPSRAMFEYPVAAGCPTCGGSGKASFTDVMLEWGDHRSPEAVVAIEAKHTEGLYPNVEEWLGIAPTPNRRAVLAHWWHLIKSSAASDPPFPELKPVVYQMLHRTDSACSLHARTRTVVLHLLFTESPEKVELYESAVQRLATIVKAVSSVEFWVVSVGCHRHPERAEFERALPKDDQDRCELVRDALYTGKPLLFEFGEPRANRISA